MRLILAVLMSLATLPAAAAVQPSSAQCAAQAVTQAGKLLAFHFGSDERAEVPGPAKPLPSIVNPANAKQRFDVLEVWGYIYKGQYRMRFEYYRAGDSCVLMGQEILEYASL